MDKHKRKVMIDGGKASLLSTGAENWSTIGKIRANSGRGEGEGR